MFSVPGWKVSAPLKAQSEPPSKSQQEHANGQHTQDRPTAAPVKKHKSAKRKRTGANEGELGANVTGANVSALWESLIEGRGSEKKTANAGKAGSSAKRRRKNRDKQRQMGKDKLDVDEGDEENEVDVSTQEGESRVKDRSQKKGRLAKEGEIDSHKPNGVSKATTTSSSTSTAPAETKLTPLQASMRAKLSSARFRHLNEKLYTTTSSASLALFAESPAMFSEYHAGFRQQVSVWPENPVEGYITDIRTRGAIKQPFNHRTAKSPTAKPEGPKSSVPLPRTHGTCIIADLGCGDAQLAQSLKGAQKLNLQVHSFDLHAANKYITKADISQLPLADGAADIAIFCLALMGTNWLDFIDEAWRVLHWKGELWVAEIKSRFARPARATPGAVVEHSVGNRQRKPRGQHKGVAGKKKTKEAEEAEERANEDALAVEVDQVTAGNASGSTNVDAFVAALRKRGFVLDGDGDEAGDAVDLRNKMFVKLRFIKATTPVRGKNAAAAAEAAAEKRQAGSTGGGDQGVGSGSGSGRGGQTWQKKPARKGSFLDPDDGAEDGGKILKPCVYKLR